MELWSLKPGASGKIKSIDNLQGPVKQRLQDMGLRVGEMVSCSHWSPLGGPRAYVLSLGHFAIEKEVALTILLEPSQ